MPVTLFHLNIGLNVGNTLTHSEADTHKAIALVFPQGEIRRSYVRRSIFGELTVCCTIACPETTAENLPARLDFLCTHLSQEAIAAKLLGQGFLCGPGAHNWNGGVFNDEAWLPAVPENNPHADGEAVVAALAGTESTARGIYTVGFHNPGGDALYGWFERDSDGSGGGLWFELQDGKLALLDYDGRSTLPCAVLEFLRLAGVDAGKEFE